MFHLRSFTASSNQRKSMCQLKTSNAVAVACLLLVGLLPTGAVAHPAAESADVSKILQELQTQGRDLRDIQALLEARAADQFVEQITEEPKDLPQRPPARKRASAQASVTTPGAQAELAAQQQRWQQALARQVARVGALTSSQRPAVEVVRNLQAVAPDLSAVFNAMRTHPVLAPELRQLATLALRRAEVVPDWIAWLDELGGRTPNGRPPEGRTPQTNSEKGGSVASVDTWVKVLNQQGHLPRAIAALRTPLSQGSLNLSRGRRAALAAALPLVDEAETPGLKQVLRSDLENIFIYGTDRLHTYSLLKPLYKGTEDQQAAWMDLIARAWRQSRHSAKEERAFAPLAAHMGNEDALHVWVADHLSSSEQSMMAIQEGGGGEPVGQAKAPAALDRIADVLSGVNTSERAAESAAGKADAQTNSSVQNQAERQEPGEVSISAGFQSRLFRKQLSELIAHPSEVDIVQYFQANRGRFVFDSDLGKYILP